MIDKKITILELRQMLRMTQKEFSKEIGVSCQTISAWETGIKVPSISNARKIEKKYDIKLVYYYG